MSADMAMPNTACLQYEVLLEDYLNATLSSTDAKRAELHLESCGACRQALENARATMEVFRAAAPERVVPDAGFSRIVMARIHAAESELTADRAGFWQSLVALGWRFAATAALALAVLVAYDAGRAHRTQPSRIAIRPIQTTDFLLAAGPAQPPADRDEVLMMVAETNHGNN